MEQIVIQSQTPPEDPAYVAEMVAKAEGLETTTTQEEPQTSPERPEWVPEKFWDAEKGEVRTEAMAKSYKELEAKRGAEPPTEPPAESTETVKAELAEKGLSLDEFSAEFQQNGTLTQESYDKLEKAGYPRAYVDQYIAGQQALAERFNTEVFNSIGGQENFQEMVSWAKANVDSKEIEAYNRAVSSGDPEVAKLAVAGLYQKFRTANPVEPSLIRGAGGAVTGDVYEDLAQMQKDMANPDYKTSPAFRKKVEQKLARSNIL